MKRRVSILIKGLLAALFFFGLAREAASQRYLTDLDSSFFIKDTLRPFLKRFENLRISGYIQPQFQVAEADGAPSFEGGNFSQFSRSRFMLRRARLKVDYLMLSGEKLPTALFTFQIDATERGVIVRDMFARLYENRHNVLSLTAGFFARPFGYEVNLSSAFRESPERGRMSQTLMPGERDLGVMASFEPQKRSHPLYQFKLDAGFFNGQGASGSTDFDSHKDFISRFSVHPFRFRSFEISGGLSLLRGGWKNGTKYLWTNARNPAGDPVFTVDSNLNNLGKSTPRHYYGADIQLKWHHGWGETELRSEYWFGTQPGTANSTANPGTLPSGATGPLPTYIRHFNGAFFYFLQDIGSARNQFLLKYDWYDPNQKVRSAGIGKAGTNFTPADIRYSALGVGYIRILNPLTRLMFYFSFVRNEPTLLAGFLTDAPDNVFTCRLQFRF